MNTASFTKWFKESLLQNIPPNSVIVMDNASYHWEILEKSPTMQWRKADMQAWVEKNVLQKYNNVEFGQNATKPELMELVNAYKTKPLHVIDDDELAKQHNHRVIRLPPYHAHFNPI